MPAFTFAVVGHDEAPRLAYALERAMEAAGPRDRVWFVDSASTDGSRAVAERLGVEVLDAPLGKGRAMAAALDRARTEDHRPDDYLCFADADTVRTEHSIPRLVRAEADRTRADLVIGEFHEPARRRMVTPFVYRPLTAALFPDVADRVPRVPLSGFRALRIDVPVGDLPPGYGIETHLNLQVALTGSVASCPVGTFEGSLRGYSNAHQIARDVAEAILDLAVATGRIDAEGRTEWAAWIEPVLALIGTSPDDDGEATGDPEGELERLARRPTPQSLDASNR